MKNKRYEVVLSVLTIMTVLTTLVGVTFAYFTGTISGTPGDVSVTTDLIGGVTFDGGQAFTTANDIEPGWSESKTFSVSAAPSNHEQKILVKMSYTNGFTDMLCKVTSKATVSGAKGEVQLVTNETDLQEVTLVEITFPASNELQTIEYTLAMEFPDTGENQNEQQGKEFNGTLFAELEGGNGMYYNDANPNGTTTKPSAQ